MIDQQRSLDSLCATLAAAERVVVFTGAGISTECGIPDFRSPGGIWSTFRIVTFGEFVGSEEARREDWRRRRKMHEVIAAAAPGSVHRLCADLHRAGRLAAVITQNIDGLHSRVGLPDDRIIELHGNAATASCLGCRRSEPMADVIARDASDAVAPTCGVCGAPMKANVVMFGESMPEQAMAASVRHAETCDLFMVFGSSLVVFPAAQLPVVAANSGATLAIFNHDPTPVDDIAECVCRSSVSEATERLSRAI